MRWADWLSPLVAQSPAPSDIAPWAGLGVSALLGWYLFYKTTVSDPKEREEHRRHVDAIMLRHEKEVGAIMLHHEQVVSAHVAAMKEMKEDHMRSIKDIRDECRYEREQFLIALQSERALFAEVEERRAAVDKQRHLEAMALASAINRLSELMSQHGKSLESNLNGDEEEQA